MRRARRLGFALALVPLAAVALGAPPDPPAVVPPGRTFVLVIGIDRFHDATIQPLRFAEADARAVSEFYVTDPRSPTDSDRVKLLCGKEATKKRVIEELEALSKKASRAEDAAVLYLASHGFATARETYVACHDTELASLKATGLSVRELQESWNEIGARHKVLFLDACHSGAVAAADAERTGTRGIGGVKVAPEAPPPPVEPGAVAVKPREHFSVVVTATGDNELSTEDPELGHGIFTTALLRGLRGQADRDGRDGVTVRELEAFLSEEVPALARRCAGKQTPRFARAAGAERLVLTRATAPTAPQPPRPETTPPQGPPPPAPPPAPAPADAKEGIEVEGGALVAWVRAEWTAKTLREVKAQADERAIALLKAALRERGLPAARIEGLIDERELCDPPPRVGKALAWRVRLE